MAQATVLAAQTAAGNSTDIVVTTTPTKISLFTTNAAGLGRVKCRVLEKDPNAVYQVWGSAATTSRVDERQPTYLNQNHPSITLISPGTYRVEKPITDNAVGVFTES